MFKDTVGELSSLPVLLQSFYTEEVVQEKTGEQVEETSAYTDEEGNSSSVTSLVDEYVGVTYLRENSRTQSTTLANVLRIIEKHEGGKDDVVDLFVQYYLYSQLWGFHDGYIEWLDSRPDLTDESYSAVDEEGNTVNDFDADLKAWGSLEPTSKPEDTLESFKLTHYAELRKAAYGSTLAQLEMQVDGIWEAHIAEVKAKYPKS